jgi:hypothetical protein
LWIITGPSGGGNSTLIRTTALDYYREIQRRILSKDGTKAALVPNGDRPFAWEYIETFPPPSKQLAKLNSLSERFYHTMTKKGWVDAVLEFLDGNPEEIGELRLAHSIYRFLVIDINFRPTRPQDRLLESLAGAMRGRRKGEPHPRYPASVCIISPNELDLPAGVRDIAHVMRLGSIPPIVVTEFLEQMVSLEHLLIPDLHRTCLQIADSTNGNLWTAIGQLRSASALSASSTSQSSRMWTPPEP